MNISFWRSDLQKYFTFTLYHQNKTPPIRIVRRRNNITCADEETPVVVPPIARVKPHIVELTLDVVAVEVQEVPVPVRIRPDNVWRAIRGTTPCVVLPTTSDHEYSGLNNFLVSIIPQHTRPSIFYFLHTQMTLV